jgi:hypothetical protein
MPFKLIYRCCRIVKFVKPGWAENGAKRSFEGVPSPCGQSEAHSAG